jgi:hypothetical protein
MCHIDKL